MNQRDEVRAKFGLDSSGRREDPLLTASEVATLFRVNPKTVTRWARSGHLPCVFTIGGHRRYRLSDIESRMRTER